MLLISSFARNPRYLIIKLSSIEVSFFSPEEFDKNILLRDLYTLIVSSKILDKGDDHESAVYSKQSNLIVEDLSFVLNVVKCTKTLSKDLLIILPVSS